MGAVGAALGKTHSEEEACFAHLQRFAPNTNTDHYVFLLHVNVTEAECAREDRCSRPYCPASGLPTHLTSGVLAARSLWHMQDMSACCGILYLQKLALLQAGASTACKLGLQGCLGKSSTAEA